MRTCLVQLERRLARQALQRAAPLLSTTTSSSVASTVGARPATHVVLPFVMSSSGSSSHSSHFPVQFQTVRFFSAQPQQENDSEEDDTGTTRFGVPVPKASTKTATAVPSTTTPKRPSKPWMMDLGLKSLLPEWARMIKTETLVTDISAGITVGCIAVPLSLAIAVASGVPPEVGLVTAAVSGVAGGLLGGTTLAITGPAAAISLLVVDAVQHHGLEALPVITLACGGLQLASGITRAGVFAKLVPVSVIAGFTVGVGTMILTGQVPKALGMAAPAGLNPVETLAFLGQNIATLNPAAAALALGTAAGMYYLPKLHPKIPSALLAVGGATLATHSMGMDVALIGQIPSGLEAFKFAIPSLPPMESLPALATTTLLIYAMTSAESLLSCAALEKMKKTPYQHNPDQELIGQGLANMGAGLFTGMPVTSVIARSSLNVKLNAETRLPALVQAGFVFGSVVVFSNGIAMIPMPALSGMLIMTGMGMLNPHEFKQCHAVQKLDVIPFLTTIGGMISFGLAEGIGVGCLTAWALNYDYGSMQVKKVALPHRQDSQAAASAAAAQGEEPHMHFHQAPLLKDSDDSVMTTTVGYQLDGPINFASMFVIDELIHQIEDNIKPGQNIVLDMQEVVSVEFTGVEELVNRLNEVIEQIGGGTSIEMWNCKEDLLNAMDQCDPGHRIERYCDEHTSSEAPYHFPAKKEEVATEKVPLWYDSPHFRPK